MTTDQAIKLIQADIDNEEVDWDSPLGRAYKLSFEALKRFSVARKNNVDIRPTLLLGETEESTTP